MPSGGEDDPADDEIQTEIKMERAKSERDIKKQILQKRAVSQKALLEAKTAQHMGGIHLLADKGQQDAVFSCLAVAFYLMVGLAYYGGELGWTVVEVMYFSMCTLTTVG